MTTDDAVKAAMDEIYKSLSVVSMIGEPIEIDEKIILPVSKMGLVLLTELQEGVPGDCAGGRAAGSAGISPIAVVVIFKGIKGPDGVRVMHLTAPSTQIGLGIRKLYTSNSTDEDMSLHLLNTAGSEIK